MPITQGQAQQELARRQVARDELERRRLFGELNLEAPEQVAATTGVVPEFPSSEAQRFEQLQTASILEQQPDPSALTKLGLTGAGVLFGLAGGVPEGATASPLGKFVQPFRGETALGAGEVIGDIGRFAIEAQALPAFKGLGLAGNVLRGGLVGILDETILQAADADDFDLTDIATRGGEFAAFDLLAGAVGKYGKKFLQSNTGKKIISKVFGEEKGAELLGKIKPEIIKEKEIEKITGVEVNKPLQFKESLQAKRAEQLLPDDAVVNKSPSLGLNLGIEGVERPPVLGGELKKMMALGEAKQPSIGERITTAGGGLETGLRMMERHGVVDEFYRPWQVADNAISKQVKSLNKDFNKQIKSKFKLGTRNKASKNIMIFATAQQKNGKKVLSEMGIDEIPILTKSEMELYQYMRGNLENVYNELQVARRNSGINPFPKVENYFTFFRNFKGEADNNMNLMSSITNNFANKLTKQSKFRFEKKRIIDDYGELDLDAFKVFETYMNSAIKHKELTPIISKHRQLLDGKFINDFKLQDTNPAAYKDLNDWVNFIAGAPQTVAKMPASIEKGMRKLSQNIGYAVLSYNLRSIGIQPTAIIGAATEINPKWVMSGVGDFFKKDLRQFALEKSHHLRGREFDVAINEIFAGLTGRVGKIKKVVGTAGIKPLQILDYGTAMVTWLGAFKKAKTLLKMTEEKAINFADDIVVKTQASAASGDISPIQRNQIGKFITLFQTFVINNWGFLTKDVAGVGTAKTKDNVRKVVTYLMGVTAVNSLFEDVLGTRSPFPAPLNAFKRELEKGGSQGDAAYASVKELLEVVPLAGGALQYGSSPFGAGIQAITDPADRNITPEKLLETGGKLIGFPGTTQIKKIIRALEK